MQTFEFWNAADLSTGLFVNSRINNLYNLSTYGKDDVITDVDLSTSVSTYANTLLPTALTYASWKTNSDGRSISTYVAGESITLQGQFQGIDIIYLNSLQGALVRHDVDSVNIESVSTYGAVGTKTTFRIQGKGDVTQRVKISNSGFSDKTGAFYGTPVNTVGSSLASAITLRPNGSQSINCTWTFKGVSGTTFRLTRSDTGTSVIYSYGQILTNAIFGFDLYVSGGSVGDKATVATNAPSVNVLAYISYPNASHTGAWVTPILNSGDPSTTWLFAENESEEASVSTYPSLIQVGNTPTPDSSWVNIIPTETAVVDYNPTQQVPGYRGIVSSINTQGQFAQATFSISTYQSRLTYPRVYAGNAVSESMINIMGPVVGGPTLQKLQFAILSVMQKIGNRVTRFIKSTAISSSEREFLIQRGLAMGFPIRKGESLTNYRTRLTLISQASTGGATISSITNLINSFLNTTKVYLVTPSGAAAAWTLGVGVLGVSTILGSKAVNFWIYEVHVPCTLSNLIPDELTKFIQLINPVGARPIIIYE